MAKAKKNPPVGNRLKEQCKSRLFREVRNLVLYGVSAAEIMNDVSREIADAEGIEL